MVMFARARKILAPLPWWGGCQARLRRLVDWFLVVMCDRHVANPVQIGEGQHDCALSSLYWAAPSIPESEILNAFNLTGETWPYGGVTNKEFEIALKYLRVENDYSKGINTLGELLAVKPEKCVALLHGHFIPIVDGVIVGHDSHRLWPMETHVYCHWTFTRRSFRSARNSRRTSAGSV